MGSITFCTTIENHSMILLYKTQVGLRVFHGLWTPNEGKNQRNLNIWADVADKYASALPKNLGAGVGFGP